MDDLFGGMAAGMEMKDGTPSDAGGYYVPDYYCGNGAYDAEM